MENECPVSKLNLFALIPKYTHMTNWCNMKCFATDVARQSASDAGKWQGLRFKCHSTINSHIKMFCFDRKQNRWGFSHGQFNKCNCFVNVFIMVLVIHWCQCAFCTQYRPLSTLINCKLCAKKYGLCDYEQQNYTHVKRFKHVTDV